MSTINALPPELLGSIFGRAIPPTALLDPALISGDQTPWCQSLRLVKSIILVRRSWYQVGVVFLYKDICIRRFPQLEGLRAALDLSKSSTQNLGALVKSLDLQCYVPVNLASEFAQTLGKIMELCPSISTFGYSSACTLPRSALPTTCLKTQITHLRLHDTVQHMDAFTILRDLQDQLLVLHIALDEHLNYSDALPVPETRLIFSSLHSLSLSPASGRDIPNTLVHTVKANWIMPSLQRLTLYDSIDARDMQGPATQYLNAVIDLLSTHGRQLLYLRMGACLKQHLLKILEKCPDLERLVMHPAVFDRTRWTPNNQVLHANLRFLDLTYSFRNRHSYANSKLWISKDLFPALQLVRHLCNIPSGLSAWLDNFHPCLEVESQRFTVRLFQHQIVYQDGALLYQDRPKLKPPAFRSFLSPDISWIFSGDTDEESYSEVYWTPSSSEDDESRSESEISWTLSSSEDESVAPSEDDKSESADDDDDDDEEEEEDEWMLDSGDDVSTFSK